MLDLTPIEGESEDRFEPVDPKERALLQAFREGDKQAFREIFELMIRPLTYFLEKIVFDPLVAEDLAAETFTKLYKVRAKFKSREYIKRWLYVVARNSGIDYIKYKVKNKTLQRELSYLQSDDETQAETERVIAAVLGELLNGMETLAPQQKKVVHMYYIEDKDTREISEELNLDSQTVLNHKALGLQRLKEFVFKRRRFPELMIILLLSFP